MVLALVTRSAKSKTCWLHRQNVGLVAINTTSIAWVQMLNQFLSKLIDSRQDPILHYDANFDYLDLHSRPQNYEKSRIICLKWHEEAGSFAIVGYVRR